MNWVFWRKSKVWFSKRSGTNSKIEAHISWRQSPVALRVGLSNRGHHKVSPFIATDESVSIEFATDLSICDDVDYALELKWARDLMWLWVKRVSFRISIHKTYNHKRAQREPHGKVLLKMCAFVFVCVFSVSTYAMYDKWLIYRRYWRSVPFFASMPMCVTLPKCW